MYVHKGFNAKAVAILPESIRRNKKYDNLKLLYSPPPVYNVLAYWHERKQQKDITVFGVLNFYTNGDEFVDKDFTLEDIYAAKSKPGIDGLIKLGHAKTYKVNLESWFYHQVMPQEEFNQFYDPIELAYLHSHKGTLPHGTLDWLTFVDK